MLLETALGEMPLLIFSLLLPASLTALGLVGFVRGFAPAAEGDEAAGGKLDALMSVPAILAILGLIASVFHLGTPLRMFGMLSGVGHSPLSNEVLVAGISFAVGIAYWIVCLVKHPGARVHSVCGLVVCALGLVTAIFTGLAYDIVTVLTWSAAYGAPAQFFLALLGGSVLAATVFALAHHDEGKKGTYLLLALGFIGAIGSIAMVLAQGSMAAGAMSSTGMTLESLMGDYYAYAIAAAIFAIAGVLLWAFAALKDRSKTMFTVAACVLVFVALALIRIDFYGIFLSVGLNVL